MTKNETARILAVIAAAYQKFQVDSEGITLNVWHEMLGDLDYKLVQLAVQKLILESPYVPTISDIRKQIVDITQVDDTDAASAWGEVVEAVRRFGHYRGSEVIKSLSPRTAKVVRMIGFREICMCEEPGVVRGQFLKMYDTCTAREKKEALLPEKLKKQLQLIGNGGGKLKVIEGGKP